MAFLEMPGKNRKPHQQAKQIGKRHPFMPEMGKQAGKTRAHFERRKQQLVQRNDDRPADRHNQGMRMKQRDAKQHQAKQNEIDRNAGNLRSAARSQRGKGQQKNRQQKPP